MLAARLNFVAQESRAVQYAAKEIFRARPETAYFAKKKLARFLLGVLLAGSTKGCKNADLL